MTQSLNIIPHTADNFLAPPPQHDAILCQPCTLHPPSSCFSKLLKSFTWAERKLFQAPCLLNGQWLQKEYIPVQVLIISPRGATKMVILWNSIIVFLKGDVAINLSDRSMRQENPRDSWDRAGSYSSQAVVDWEENGGRGSRQALWTPLVNERKRRRL